MKAPQAGSAACWSSVPRPTAHVVAQLLAEEERERQQQLLGQMPGFVAVLRGPHHIYE